MILDKIVNEKKIEVLELKKNLNIKQLEELIKKQHDCLNFSNALNKNIGEKNRIISEVKKASPSKGIIREDFAPVEIAKEYENNGAVAISVLTDEKFFMGKLEYLSAIKKNTSIPVFRKDFIIDPIQIYESKAFGADALLLIAAILNKNQLKDFLQLARELSIHAMVEVHTKEELTMALEAGSSIIGINNRDLKTFKIDLKTTFDMIKHIDVNKTVVSESGIKTIDDVLRLKDAGVDAFLVGESFMKSENAGQKLSEFVG